MSKYIMVVEEPDIAYWACPMSEVSDEKIEHTLEDYGYSGTGLETRWRIIPRDPKDLEEDAKVEWNEMVSRLCEENWAEWHGTILDDLNRFVVGECEFSENTKIKGEWSPDYLLVSWYITQDHRKPF